jgi:hypothetical protein
LKPGVVGGALIVGGVIALSALIIYSGFRAIGVVQIPQPDVEVLVLVDNHGLTLTNEDDRVVLYECRVHIDGATASVGVDLEPHGRASVSRQQFSREMTLADFIDRAARSVSLTCFDKPDGRRVPIRVMSAGQP